MAEVAARNGALARVIVNDGAGLRFFHLWQDEEGMRKTAEEMGDRIQDLGYPEQEDWQQFEVVHHVTQGT